MFYCLGPVYVFVYDCPLNVNQNDDSYSSHSFGILKSV